VDFYSNATDIHESAEILFNNGKYRMAVYNVCLSVELYLKSKLLLVDYEPRLESSHDTINIYRCLTKRFKSSKDLTYAINMCRKYFNESRYPYGTTEVYTSEFASEFLEYLSDVKFYIDNECVATLDDLKAKFDNN